MKNMKKRKNRRKTARRNQHPPKAKTICSKRRKETTKYIQNNQDKPTEITRVALIEVKDKKEKGNHIKKKRKKR